MSKSLYIYLTLASGVPKLCFCSLLPKLWTEPEKKTVTFFSYKLSCKICHNCILPGGFDPTRQIYLQF